MLDLVIGHGFNIEAAMKLKVDEVQQLLLDEDSHENALDKTLFNGDTLLKIILIASDGHYITLENVAQWSDNKELFDYLVDLQVKQEVVSSGNESQATGLGSQSKQLYQEKSASEGEAYAQRILSGFETGSAPEEVISIHYNIDFPHELSVECCKRGYLGILQFLEDCGLNFSPNPQVLWDPHITAVQYGHINVADFLLQRGFSVNSSDGSSAGWSPLQWACQSPHMDPRKKKEMVSFLLTKVQIQIIQAMVATHQWTLLVGCKPRVPENWSNPCYRLASTLARRTAGVRITQAWSPECDSRRSTHDKM